MRRWIVPAIAAVAVGAGWWLLTTDGPALGRRQASVQEIPGTLGYALEPPPDDLVPTLSPDQVRERYPADGGEVQVSLASLRDVYQDRIIGSGWVLVARGVCLRNQKGELVSDARGNDPVDLQCTPTTIWLLAVDATTGAPIAALAGHDQTERWTLDVA